VGAALAIFITIGATLYGFSIKEAADKVSASADKVRDVADKIRDTADKVREQREAIDSQAKAINGTDEQIRKAKDDVDQQVKTLHDNAQRVSDISKEIATVRQQVEDLYAQIRRDAAQAHNLIAGQGNGSKDTHPFTVPELMQLYNFPTEFDGNGQVIGLIELGGGFRDSDLDAYFAGLKLPKPKVTVVAVGGVKNDPDSDPSAASQVALDIEVAGAVAPGAHVVVYFASNTNSGFLNAVDQAVHDSAHHPSVISISWGSNESAWSTKALQAINAVLKDAATLGISVVAAAGDRGVTDGAPDHKPHVDFPASSPYVLAVGGTKITTNGTAIVSEVAWNSDNGFATGGGVSEVFPLPEWQQSVKVPLRADGGAGRGLPDVAANADPSRGYRVVINGLLTVVGGTAAATPFWAGLITLINQGAGRNVGYINPILYQRIGPSAAFRGVVQGNNSLPGVKGYAAGPGWNAVAGWGSPDGRKLLAAFKQ
jgi:kumamolisin